MTASAAARATAPDRATAPASGPPPATSGDALARAVARLHAEYREMPCLSLTAPQAARLLWLERPVASAALRALEEAAFLARTRDGRFVRRTA